MTSPRFGLHLWPQATTWAELRHAAARADAVGFDSLWTWDHLIAIQGPEHQVAFEGWGVITSWAHVTKRATLGLLVGANTLRSPGLVAKQAVTLDHVSEGRAVLGIGGGWVEREHREFGIPFGSGFGERLDRLDDAVRVLRRLLAGEEVTEEGRFYAFDHARVLPGPWGERLPILVGGSGPTKTLATVARYADAWNHLWVGAEQARVASERLDEHLERAGRAPEAVERTISVPIIIRDEPAAAHAAFRAAIAHNGADVGAAWGEVAGPPEVVAGHVSAMLEVGFEHVIFRMPAPFDHETIERMTEVRALLDGSA